MPTEKPQQRGYENLQWQILLKVPEVFKRITDIIASKPSSGFGYFLELMSRKTIPDIIFHNFCD